MKTLIGMREFVLLEFSKRNVYYYQDSKVLNKINNYANFLSRQPQLSDFVACGEDGLPLQKPNEHLENRTLYYQELESYQKALDKVLFKGFEIYSQKIFSNPFFKLNDSVPFEVHLDGCTIEDLVIYNLELTDNVKNIINGNI